MDAEVVPKPVVLLVLDGFGLSLETRGNAVAEARKPNLEAIEKRYPFTALQASGLAVGLPWGEPGNSEVGHLTMGSGRVIYHHLPRITAAIEDGSFFENPAFLEALVHVRKNRSALHLVGLISSGAVHSYLDHLFALLELAKRSGDPPVFIHAITDGRDAMPREGKAVVADIEKRIASQYPKAAIVSLIGRFYAMDRDSNWERIRKAYELVTKGNGAGFRDAVVHLAEAYAAGISDEFIEPAWRRGDDGRPLGRIGEGDGLIFFNFREDSMRELASAFSAESFSGFERERPPNLKISAMTEYEKDLPGVKAAFPPPEVVWPLARVLAEAGKRQLRIAETEKYAHVTYFFNGWTEKPFPNEDRILIPSLSVPHFDEYPEMRAPEITAKILEKWEEYDFILANLANADMVGHAGNFGSAVRAIESVDKAVGQLTGTAELRGGTLLITADHGNAEEARHPRSGEPMTEHTSNPVPFYLIAKEYGRTTERSPEEISAAKKETAGILADIAPTILELMRLKKPKEMTGKSLLTLLLKER